MSIVSLNELKSLDVASLKSFVLKHNTLEEIDSNFVIEDLKNLISKKKSHNYGEMVEVTCDNKGLIMQISNGETTHAGYTCTNFVRSDKVETIYNYRIFYGETMILPANEEDNTFAIYDYNSPPLGLTFIRGGLKGLNCRNASRLRSIYIRDPEADVDVLDLTNNHDMSDLEMIVDGARIQYLIWHSIYIDKYYVFKDIEMVKVMNTGLNSLTMWLNAVPAYSVKVNWLLPSLTEEVPDDLKDLADSKNITLLTPYFL